MEIAIDFEDFSDEESSQKRRILLDSPVKRRLLRFSNDDFIRHQVLFFSLKPNEDGTLSAHKSRAIFVQSKLSLKVLSQIWKLLDKTENDAFTLSEFSTCLRLIQAAICGLNVPDTLPVSLQHKQQQHQYINVPEISSELIVAYDFIFHWLKPDSENQIEAWKVINFLSCSKLSAEVLGKVWTYCDIDCDGWLSFNEFFVALHLTIFSKSKSHMLNGVLDTYRLFPPKQRFESISEKEDRLIELQLRKKLLMEGKIKSRTNKKNTSEILKQIEQVERQEYELKQEIKDPNTRIQNRTGLNNLFVPDFIIAERKSGEEYVQSMKESIQGADILREPETIFNIEKITKYSKTLVVSKRLEPKKRSKSEVQRRLTSELLALSEDIETLRRETSSNFEELNKEFEQVKASVGREDSYADVFDAEDAQSDPFQSDEDGSFKWKESKKVVNEDLQIQTSIQVEESQIDFDHLFASLNQSSTDIKTPVQGESAPKVKETSPVQDKSALQVKEASLSRAKSPTQKVSKTGSLRRSNSQRGSLRRRSISKSNENLAADVSKIFEQLSIAKNNNVTETSNDSFKPITKELSADHSDLLNPTVNIHSTVQDIDKNSLRKDKEGLSHSHEKENKTQSTGRNLLSQKRQEFLTNTKSTSSSSEKQDTEEQEKVITQAAIENDDRQETNLQDLDTKAVFKNSRSIFEQGRANVSTPSTSENKKQSQLDQIQKKIPKTQDEDKIDQELGIKSKSQSLERKSDRIVSERFSGFYREIGKSNTLPRTKKRQTEQEQKEKPNDQFVDKSVKRLLRKISFQSNENLISIKDVKAILEEISPNKEEFFKPRSGKRDVNSILRNLSFKNKNMEEKQEFVEQSDQTFTEQERRRLAFDKRRRRSKLLRQEEDASGKVVLDRETLDELQTLRMQNETKPINLFYNGNNDVQSSASLNGNNPSHSENLLDDLIAKENIKHNSLASLNESKFQSKPNERKSEGRQLHNRPLSHFEPENNMFFNEEEAEEKRKNFVRSKSDASFLDESNKNNKLVMRTKSGRVVKQGTGLINRNDPSQVSFQEESEWLEKLVGAHVIAHKDKDLSNIEKRKSTDFTLIGSPFLPSSDDDSKRKSLVMQSEESEEDEKQKLKTKSEHVEEESIKVNHRKSWLENLVKEGQNTQAAPSSQTTPRSANGNVVLSEKTTPRAAQKELTTPRAAQKEVTTPSVALRDGVQTSQRVTSPNLISRTISGPNQYTIAKSDPHQFVNPSTVAEKKTELKQTTSKEIPKDIVSENTNVEEVFSPNDDESRGNAYMLPSLLRKHKNTEEASQPVNKSIEMNKKIGNVKKVLESGRNSAERNRITKNQSVESVLTAAPNTKATNRTDSVALPSTPSAEENEDQQFKIPSIKEKMHLFQKQKAENQKISNQKISKDSSSQSNVPAKTHPVGKNKKVQGQTNNVLHDDNNKSQHGKSNGRMDLNNNNNNNNGVEYKHCVKDQRILNEIAELEQRENEIKSSRNKQPMNPRTQHDRTAQQDNTHNEKNVTSRKFPAGLAAFLQENEARE